jgi:glucose/arabinose dehydrogenase
MNRVKIAVSILSVLIVAFPSFNRAAASNESAAPTAQEVTPARIQLEQVVGGLSSPIYVTNAKDTSNRLFIVEKPGRIKVLQPGATSPTVFLDIVSRVRSAESERGLLGLAFHPQFVMNRRFFVNYTRQPDGATVISEFRVSATNPNVAETTETVLLTIPQPFANHNGGMIEFGPDELLYIGMGDGGDAFDPGNRAQNIEELLGKMLRIDVDRPAGGLPYSSPADNPFFGSTPGRDEIYAVGLRNPWRFSFDRATGQLIAGDVGQGQREEIDIITRGGNYGWRVFEGTVCTNRGPASCATPGFTAPIAEYAHTNGRCSITGGYVYRGVRSTFPTGAYIYGDFCTGEIFMLRGSAQTPVIDAGFNISSFGEDEAGELYVVNIGGSVHRIVETNSPPPVALSIDSAVVRRRSNGELLDPLIVVNNAKKYNIIVRGQGFGAGAVILINGREMNTDEAEVPGTLVARLRKSTLRQAGPLNVQVRSGGATSNALNFEVLPDTGQ